MKKVLTAIAVTLVALTLCVCFTACNGNSQTGTIVDVDYGTILKDYLAYPDDVNVTSITDGREGAKEEPVDIEAIYNNDSLSVTQKIAKMMYGATINEIACDHFSYFTNKIGSTNLGKNQGTLIYQRLRRQDDSIKDDTTIKMPFNHNFNSMASTFVTSADIRYVADGRYNRMNNDSDIIYNTKTGILEVKKWQKQSKGNWNKPEKATDSRSYSEARKTVINWNATNIISAEGATIVPKTDDNGNNYYELTFSIDIEVANKDSETIKQLEEDNGGSGMKFEYCRFVAQIWDCGLAKRYDIEESWNGQIKIYSGSAQNKQTTVFSYSKADMDYSVTDGIFKSIK